MDGILVNWIQKADIQFDRSGTLTLFKEKMLDVKQSGVMETEKMSFWQKINYNYVANKRYYKSEDKLYHEALELRLLYSTMELICGFLALRDIPWRGEKNAVVYIKENEKKFYEVFSEYCKASSLDDRFKQYEKMVLMTFTEKFKQWTEDGKIIIKKDQSIVNVNDKVTQYIDLIL